MSSLLFAGAAFGIGGLFYFMSRKQTKVVCVTGGSGFLGSWCVKILLERGYVVRATTRSPGKAEYLKNLPGAAERLTIISGCDLLVPGSFDAAIEGCDVVLHTASPFFVKGGSEENLVKPALEGTQNVLNTCHNFRIPEVVLTSSTAAVYACYGTKPNDHVWSESDWSDVELMKEYDNWYCLSKTLAEQEAWKISKQPGCSFKLSVMNPCLIFGPMIKGQKHLNTSTAAMLPYIDGTKGEIENACKNIVDVRDVALAHVLAFETGKVWGSRCCLVAGSPHWSEISDYIRECVDFKDMVPTKVGALSDAQTVYGSAAPNPTVFDTSVSEDLGIDYFSIRDQVQTNIRSALANGFSKHSQYIPGK